MIKGLIPSVGVLAVSLCLVSPVWAISTVINFEASLENNEAPPIPDFDDVSFGKGDASIHNVWNFGRSGFSGKRMATSMPKNSDPYRADFKLGGVNFVSVVLGDGGADDETLFLEAYGSNGFLGRVDSFYKADQSNGVTLALASKNSEISYVLFGSKGERPNSVDFDDFTYSTENSALPEPSSILLLGTGLAGLAAWRYKKSHLLKDK